MIFDEVKTMPTGAMSLQDRFADFRSLLDICNQRSTVGDWAYSHVVQLSFSGQHVLRRQSCCFSTADTECKCSEVR